MAQIAFVTYEKRPNITEDDELAAQLLRNVGITVNPVIWDAPDVDWSDYACAVIRATWDYHMKIDAYVNWLNKCRNERINLWNPPDIILTNTNKRYLSDLSLKGIEVVPFVYVPSSSTQDLAQIITAQQWNEVVVKPAVSASGIGVWRTSLEAATTDQTKFADQISSQDVLIQPFMNEVVSEGEWSFMFFGGEYSHAVLKKPAKGDFRVQGYLGGSYIAMEPPKGLVDQAQKILSLIDGDVLYARIDGINRNGLFVLMELEINEPHLFFNFSPDAPNRFAAAIKAVLA